MQKKTADEIINDVDLEGKLVLICGLPGSGKTTLAKKLASKYGVEHCENDQYFESGDKYVFDISKIGEANDLCKKKCENSLDEHGGAVVSNTFTCDAELLPYMYLAELYGIDEVIIFMETAYKSIHNVPQEAIDRMKSRIKNNLSVNIDYVVTDKH